KGKSADGFAAFGPYLVTRDAFPTFSRAHLWLKVNGAMKQDASTEDLIFEVPTVVSYLSRFMTLLPGDVVEYGIDGLGEARQRVVAGGAP
ncbi:MAG TPA: fumarylacetoacetate hydrolase family protein, partial [Polyangia bacterium]|nr:fumarylacetoacetate hydrolase family protein [Polyangia bacterium]